MSSSIEHSLGICQVVAEEGRTNMDDHLKDRKKHYDVRKAAEQFSNIATVLAGFAFAAVILVVQSASSSSSPLPNLQGATLLRERAAIAFLLSFFGCTLAAFTFATVAGEEELSSRSHAMALLGGAGFAVSTVYVIFGLVLFIRLHFLSPDLITSARAIFVAAVLMAPAYLILSAVDPLIAFGSLTLDQIPTKIKKQLWPLGYIPIIVGALASLLKLPKLIYREGPLFSYLVMASLLLILIGSAWALLASDREHSYCLQPLKAGLWICVHSCVYMCLILLLP